MTRLAVFDLDGTLVDTAPDLADTLNVVLAAHDMDEVPPAVVRDEIGLGARAMIQAALKETGRPLPAAEIETLLDAFLVHYESRIARLSRPFDEIARALPALRDAGVAMAVCTNKREGMARKLLDALSLSDHFVALTGGDTFDVRKPDPEHLLRTVALAGASPEHTVFVGDSRVDFETARAAGIPLVGLSYGYSDVPMETLAPDRLCRPGEDIAAAILSLFPQREAP